MTHHYERHGTTTLFAATNVLDGTVIDQNIERHSHKEFIRFLNVVEKRVSVGKTIHAVVDKNAGQIIAAVKRGHQVSDSIHQAAGRSEAEFGVAVEKGIGIA